jgi:outer membrane receptor for ferric coprogen and ferric-rhodotorulic acid
LHASASSPFPFPSIGPGRRLPGSGHAAAGRLGPGASAGRAFDIAAQPLGGALHELARQAGLQLALDLALVLGRQAPAVQGHRDVGAALESLLRGSGLQGHVEQGMLTVQPVPAATGTEPSTLAEVKVVANQLGEITEGSGLYTPGAIATATRLVLTPRETPQSVSVVTRQKMDDFQLNSIDEVMEHTPG